MHDPLSLAERHLISSVLSMELVAPDSVFTLNEKPLSIQPQGTLSAPPKSRVGRPPGWLSVLRSHRGVPVLTAERHLIDSTPKPNRSSRSAFS